MKDLKNINIDNAKAQMRKGILEYCILLILNKKDAYAPDIINHLKNFHLIIVEGTLYPLLSRLKNTGLLVYRWEESFQGPPRKYYTITELGKSYLNMLDESWHELINSIESIKKSNY